MKVPCQPEVNIGMVGHVDHGKTTLTKILTGEWTDRHSEEMRRGITIKLGYADVAIYLCPVCGVPEGYTTSEKCKKCGSQTDFQRAVSFVDAPGHETLMATMLSGAAIMNGALLLIAANEECPQPQTKEHLKALEICGVTNIIIVQNKIDVVSEEQARKNYQQIKNFVKGTIAENSPIIPVSAHHDVNIDILIEYIQKVIKTPDYDRTKTPKMYIARSFDINLPGTPIKDLKGGVLGGTLIQGKFSINTEIEIVPGYKISTSPKIKCTPLRTKITSLMSGEKTLETVYPGGLVAIGTELDPTLTRSDALTGQLVGLPGTLPPYVTQITIDVHLLDRVVGTVNELKVERLKKNDMLMLNVGTATTVGTVTSTQESKAEISLKLSVAVEKFQRVALSRLISGKWRLIGYGLVN